MSVRRILVALAAVASLSAARTAAAQASAAGRVVATYAVAGARGDLGAPARLTVADERGALVASVRLFGESEARPMTVTVMHTDLVLQADTPRGLLTFVLDRQNERAGGEVTGRWSLGGDRGTLRGRVRRG